MDCTHQKNSRSKQWCVVLLSALFGCVLLPSYAFASDTDFDEDMLTNDMEAIWHTDPNNPDTDGDGFLDGIEIKYGYTALEGNGVRVYNHDLDKDGLSDWHEYWFKSSIGLTDTDNDGKNDLEEVLRGQSPVEEGKVFERKIVVNRSTQQMQYLVDGIDIKTFPISTGNPNTETPEGVFEILDKKEKKDYIGPGYHMKDVMWNMLFKKGGYYLHSAYWHNDFGKRTHSHGCVNMTIADAKFLYPYIDVGVSVAVIGKTPAKFKVGT